MPLDPSHLTSKSSFLPLSRDILLPIPVASTSRILSIVGLLELASPLIFSTGLLSTQIPISSSYSLRFITASFPGSFFIPTSTFSSFQISSSSLQLKLFPSCSLINRTSGGILIGGGGAGVRRKYFKAMALNTTNKIYSATRTAKEYQIHFLSVGLPLLFR